MVDSILHMVCNKYDITLKDLAILIDNFKTYIKEQNVENVVNLLKYRKSKYKEIVKKSKLKSRLRKDLTSHIQAPISLIADIFSDKTRVDKYLTDPIRGLSTKGNIQSLNNKCFWTKDEEKILFDNLNKIKEDYKIEDVNDLFFKRCKETSNFKQEINFKSLLVQGLTGRTEQQAYLKCYYMLRKFNERKIWTEEEIETLLLLAKQFKSDWILIGKELNRSSYECHYKYKGIKVADGFKRNKGKWTEKECKKIRKIIRKIMKVPKNTFVYKNIPWKTVSEYVKTRSADDCRKHWLLTFSCIKLDNKKRNFSDNIFFMFIQKIKESKVKLWKVIDWEFLWENFDKGEYTPSPFALSTIIREYLRKKTKSNINHGSKIRKLIKKLFTNKD